jgi:hypothetical protein
MSVLIRLNGCVIALVLAGSAAAEKPTVSDTGYEIIPVQTPSLYWVDDNRLLFAGIKRADMDAAIAAKDVGRVARLKKLYLWDEITRSTRLYADAQGACFSNGFIHYTVRVDKAAGRAVVREGPFGSEKEIEKPLPSAEELSTQGQMARVYSNFTCKTHLRHELVPPAERNHYIAVLREGDGYLHLGPEHGGKERRSSPRNLTLYRDKTGEAIKLPMTWEEEIARYEVAYSEYRRAYVLRPQMPRGSPLGRITAWPKGQPLVVYLLWMAGRVESASIPYFHTPGLGDPRPTKAGWIFGGGYFDEVGLYLFDGKTMSKLDTGAEREIAVSPNGCRAAVGIENRFLEKGYSPINLKVFRFCARR